MRPLFHIQNDMVNTLLAIEESGEELDTQLEAFIASLESEESVKLDDYLMAIEMLRGDSATAKSMADKYTKLAQSRANRADYLQDRILKYLQSTGRKKVMTASTREITVVRNGGKLPVNVSPELSPDKMHPGFVRVKMEFDRDAMREALLSGEEIPGVSLGEPGYHVRIK